MYFRLIKLNFPFIKGEGKRRKLSFPSTVDNFRYTFRSLQYSFIASYDAKNELKKSNAPGFAEGGWAVLALTSTLGVFLD